MKDFVAINFETANPGRVSACAFGYTLVSQYEVIESKGYLLKPVGGHAEFLTKIHGIKHGDTFNKPDFAELFPHVKHLFEYPLVSYTLFDEQVLSALSNHFDLDLWFNHVDLAAVAKEKVKDIKNYKLESLVEYFDLPAFKQHDVIDNSLACARVFINLFQYDKKQTLPIVNNDKNSEFKGFIKGILADEAINYKEAYSFLYWLEDNIKSIPTYQNVYSNIKETLEDDQLDQIEETNLKLLLQDVINN